MREEANELFYTGKEVASLAKEVNGRSYTKQAIQSVANQHNWKRELKGYWSEEDVEKWLDHLGAKRWTGEKIKNLRKFAKWRQLDLANKFSTYTRQTTISSWELEVNKPSLPKSKELTEIAKKVGFIVEVG